MYKCKAAVRHYIINYVVPLAHPVAYCVFSISHLVFYKPCGKCNNSSKFSSHVYSKILTVRLNYTIYKVTIPWPPIILYMHKMNFDVLWARNSSPQLEVISVSCYVEWRSLNYAFCYDVVLGLSRVKTHPHNLRWAVMLNGSLWTMPSVMM